MKGLKSPMGAMEGQDMGTKGELETMQSDRMLCCHSCQFMKASKQLAEELERKAGL